MLFRLPSWQVHSKTWFLRCLCPCVCGVGSRWILFRSSNWPFDQFSPNISHLAVQKGDLASKACKLITWGQFDYIALCKEWGGGVRRWGKIVKRRWREHGWSVRVEQIRREEKLLEPPAIQSAWCYVKEKIHWLLWTCHVGGIHQHNWIILLCSPNSKARIRCGAFWLDRDMRATWVVQGHELSLGWDGFLRRHNGTRWHIHLFPSPAPTPSATCRVFCSESVQFERGRPNKWLFQMLWEVLFHILRMREVTNSRK